MMKALMHLDRSQVPRYIVYSTPGHYEFNKIKHLMAGYTRYEALIVGASGGRCGDALGSASGERSYSCGGGGGGCIHIAGLLTELMDITEIEVGAKGVDGNNSTSAEAPAGDGGTGWETWFQYGPDEFFIADGGSGANGGEYDAGLTRDMLYPSMGGNGGATSLVGLTTGALGSGGAGGRAFMPDPDGNIAGTPAEAGIWEAAPPELYPVVGAGIGGGGGAGKVKRGSTIYDAAKTGAEGHLGGPYFALGQAADTNDGGYGGGVNIDPFLAGTGAPLFQDAGSGHANGNGIVALKFS